MERPAKARVTDAAIAAAVTVALGGVGVSFWASVAAHRSVAGTTFNAAVVVAFTTVGAVIAAARPGNRVGWLMLSGGVAWSGGSALVDVAHHGIVDSPGSVAGASAYAVVGSACRSVGWYLETLAVPMYFPDGRLAGRRYRWLGPALLVVLATAVLDPLTDTQADLTNFGSWHNPIAPSGSARVISLVAFLGHIPFGIVATVAVVAGLVSRWRRGDALQRQQLTLFAGAAALTLAAVPIAFGLGAGSWIFGAAAFPLPVAIGFAVLARGLYDLRTAANRTLVWLTLSAVVAGTYALVIAGVARLLDVDRRMTSLPWIAAAVIAVSFAPLRDSLQRAVNRITYGRWDEPYDVLAALGTRLEGTADVDRLLRDVVAELHELGLRDVVICDARGSVVAGDPVVNGTDDGQIALTAYGESVGALRYRQSTTTLRRRDRQLLEDLAGHLGGVLHAQRLTRDVQLARERLVLAREEERRRLRRDLHDGLGPALAGHLLRLDVLAARIGRDSAAAADIDSLRADLRATVDEVRRVVEGLRPPALDELGLASALEHATQRLAGGTSTRVSVQTHELPRLSAAVEVAAFRIVTEAVTNVVRHAAASTCTIELTGSVPGELRITVTDDGCGLQAGSGSTGHGLQTMRERAEELRGLLRVASGADGRGTVVTALLPAPTAQPSAVAARSQAAAR